ncbi:MAG: hypothetical protein AAF458_19905 [Pseudomonadota bacterium]
MLAELGEADATGDIAIIYDEIRSFCAVPYVSSLQRHLATRPGWLEWAWQSARPVFASGIAQEAAWEAARCPLQVKLPWVPEEVRSLWQLTDAEAGAIRSVGALFVRVSPTNLMLSAMVRKLLAGEVPGGAQPRTSWTPPEPVPAPPAMVDTAAVAPDLRGALLRFSTEVAGQPFVPGLYRMLARWPGYFGFLTTVLAPRFQDPDIETACRTVQLAIDAAAEHVFTALPKPSGRWPMPPASEHAEVLDAVERYRETSPQMIVFGRMIGDSLA